MGVTLIGTWLYVHGVEKHVHFTDQYGTIMSWAREFWSPPLLSYGCQILYVWLIGVNVPFDERPYYNGLNGILLCFSSCMWRACVGMCWRFCLGIMCNSGLDVLMGRMRLLVVTHASGVAKFWWLCRTTNISNSGNHPASMKELFKIHLCGRFFKIFQWCGTIFLVLRDRFLKSIFL